MRVFKYSKTRLDPHTSDGLGTLHYQYKLRRKRLLEGRLRPVAPLDNPESRQLGYRWARQAPAAEGSLLAKGHWPAQATIRNETRACFSLGSAKR